MSSISIPRPQWLDESSLWLFQLLVFWFWFVQAVGTPLSLATACLISNGHTRLSGLSMWCPLWSNDNPRTTPPFPPICRTTFPFLHSARFFLSATINTIYPISRTFEVLRVIRWVSIRLWTYSRLHLFQAWFLASLSRLLSALVSSSLACVAGAWKWWALEKTGARGGDRGGERERPPGRPTKKSFHAPNLITWQPLRDLSKVLTENDWPRTNKVCSHKALYILSSG